MNKVILYDLDKSYTNLIKLVINKTKKQIIKDIRYIAYIHNEPQELVSYMFFEHAKDILG